MALKFAANLTLLYPHVPFLERFALAANDGFHAVECLFPYDYPADELKQILDTNGLTLVLHNLPPGNWEAGERGIACLPDRVEEFRAGVGQGIRYAQRLGVSQLNCLAGLKPAGISEQEAMETLRENLRYAAEQFAQAGLMLNLEAINSRVDMPGFLLDTGEKTIALIESLRLPNLRFQYDIYHMQIMGGDLCRRLQTWLPYIGHIQFADNPGRHQPGTGEINFFNIFQLLERLGYAGWISAEYHPQGDTSSTLGWRSASVLAET
ncbi:MAG: hydroxypyruvate isomerase [Hahellaceae bacterium]|nr:hydroxypyruvate isomerase [Hahellaceae bacterium]